MALEAALSVPPPTVSLPDRVLRRASRLILRSPDRVLRKIAGDPPINDRGIQLDLHIHVLGWLDKTVNGSKALATRTVAEARANLDRSIQLVAKASPHVRAQDQQLTPHVRGRIYRKAHDHGTSAPTLVFVHGGGWTLGSLDSHDALCRRLCNETGRLIISVDYRMAPEHPFPTPLNDVLEAWQWVLDNVVSLGGDPNDIVMGGDSAGGNLTAAACLVLRDQGGTLPHRQLLIYPGVDMHCASQSHQLFANGAFLCAGDIRWYLAHYAAPDPDDFRASPKAAERLDGLPPALVITAGFDPLRDEGEWYAEHLQAAGVPVVHLDAATLVHGFVSMDGAISEADRWVRKMIEELNRGVQIEGV
ncbi:MAG: alpha/beta hydrolase fold domain-containing protein [Rhodobacterales bacterium]|nr:alpha/beta hydrolase fold domain-containing protein [Rhodobacterales bacterium]